jgi:hypothetical protein
MPRYYFDLSYDDEPWSEDPEGVELASKEQARIEAVELAAAVTKEQARSHRKIEVRARDDGPEPIVIVTLSVSLVPPD